MQDCDVLVDMCHYLSGTAPSKVFAAYTGTGSLRSSRRPPACANLVLSHVTTQFDRPGTRERVLREEHRVRTDTEKLDVSR